MSQIIVQNTMLKVFKATRSLGMSGLLKCATPVVLRADCYSVDKQQPMIPKSVFISQSSDIFSNLALEDWMYTNFDFSKHHVLLLWRNDPCVVIGRHQNPWMEANMSAGTVKLARRNSGGGTVYHDKGNLNLTFFTPREQYNRKNNLEIISRALFREWGLETEINKREDIVIQGNKKISGTASKLGRPNAYHHCTLLVDVNKSNLSQVLQKQDTGITSNATRSTPSPVLNLSELEPSLTMEKLIATVGWEYLRTHARTLQDGGEEHIEKQYGFAKINPIEYYFPGLDEIRSKFVGWEWRFGKSPNFNASRSFAVRNVDGATEDSNQELSISLKVTKGVVEDATIKIPSGLMPATGLQLDTSITDVRGSRFDDHTLETLGQAVAAAAEARLDSGTHFGAENLRQTVKNV